MKKNIAIFLVFFIGTSGLIMVDQMCKESTGAGGDLGISIERVTEGEIQMSFLGLEKRLNL